MRTDDFDFVLPPDRIATEPARPRDAARLLRVADTLQDVTVRDLPYFLRAGDVMVFNDTRVIPSRLYGRRGAVAVEILLHQAKGEAVWSCFAKPAKRLKAGQTVEFAEDFSAEILARDEDGLVLLRFRVGAEKADVAALRAAFLRHGHMPLPPYIARKDTAQDRQDYQTVYAAREGSVAAPTAGLHFTPELLAAIDAMGVSRVMLTLHVGAGTFLPVKAEQVKDHKMHAEWGEITESAANTLNEVRAAGGRVLAVGTTSLRLLESSVNDAGRIAPFLGETSIFITPGFRFRAVDRLWTNFHLPRSTLFMLVCAFAGMARMRAAYEHAITKGYRFYSYGDASLLERA